MDREIFVNKSPDALDGTQPARPPVSGPARERHRRGRHAHGEQRRGGGRDGGGSANLWLYGRHAVAAALANPRRSCHRLLATPEAAAWLGPAIERPGLAVETVDRATIDRTVGADTAHQGLALHVAPLPVPRLERACAPEPTRAGRNLVLALDSITDPRNLGAILRSAAAFDARAVIVPERRSAELGGATAKAAAGALERVPVVEVVNLVRAFEALRELGYTIAALDAHAEATIDEAAPTEGDLVLVLGAEGKGLRRLVRERSDLALRLPISAAVESLNVAVAAGIALYALSRGGATTGVNRSETTASAR